MTTLRQVPENEVYRFALRALRAAGADGPSAEYASRGMCLASLRGVDSHGIRLLPHYVRGLESGRINRQPRISRRRVSLTQVKINADHGLGYAAGVQAMDSAVALAEENGVGMAVVGNSSHCGMMAYYALRACAREMIGMAFTHASPKIRTPNAGTAYFGTNPICFAAPMRDEPPLCFDAAVSAITGNKVEILREQGLRLPAGAAVDRHGRKTTDPARAVQLIPIGGYKGFGLAMMVDVLCGLLSGMPVGKEVSTMFGPAAAGKRCLGQVYIAIRIASFVPAAVFRARLQSLAEAVRSERPLDGKGPVYVPGDPEKRTEDLRRRQGIPFTPQVWAELRRLAQRLEIAPLPAHGGSPS